MDKMKKTQQIVLNVLMYAFLALSVFVVLFTVTSKTAEDGAKEFLGYQLRVVASESMAKSEYTDVSAYKIKDLPLRTMILVQTVPKDEAKAQQWYNDLKVGDVLTFRYVYTTQITITHRITGIVERENGWEIVLSGDNKTSEAGQAVQVIDTSALDDANYIIGKVVGKSYLMGVVINFLMQPLGMVLLIIVPCVAIIGLEIGKIVKVVTKEKKERERKEHEEKALKEQELEALRRRLAELENTVAAKADPTEGKEE